MKAVLIGIKPVDVKTKDGEQIKGTKLYMNIALAEPAVGYEGEQAWVSSMSDHQPPRNIKELIGSEIDIEYNKYGKVSNIKYGG